MTTLRVTVVTKTPVVRIAVPGPPGPPGTGVNLTPAEWLSKGGIWYGTQAELDVLDVSLKKTLTEWLTTGTGYFEFHVFPDASGVFIVAGSTADLGLEAFAPTVLHHRVVLAPTADLGLSAGVPSIAVVSPGVFTVEAATADLGLSAGTPTVLHHRIAEAVTADLGLTAGIPTVSVVSPGVYSIEAVTADLGLTANSPAVAVLRLIQAVTADLALTGNVPTVVRVLKVTAPTAALTLEANAPTVTVVAPPGGPFLYDFEPPTGLGSIVVTHDEYMNYSYGSHEVQATNVDTGTQSLKITTGYGDDGEGGVIPYDSNIIFPYNLAAPGTLTFRAFGTQMYVRVEVDAVLVGASELLGSSYGTYTRALPAGSHTVQIKLHSADATARTAYFDNIQGQ